VRTEREAAEPVQAAEMRLSDEEVAAVDRVTSVRLSQ